ncbi:MAG: outer membrane beta-barrel protein [Candidatus Eisenbacteria bacterium]|nr:outer membrane beta-barrel protein [Candidatus Eisenbacteria bacterium]
MRTSNTALAVALAALAALASPLCRHDDAVAAEAKLGIFGGAGWAAPLAGSVSDSHGSGPMLRLGLALTGESFGGSLGLGAYRDEASLSHPAFVESAKSTLLWLPIALEANYRMPEADRSPYASLGLELWVLREAFEYRINGSNEKADGNRTALAGVLGVGYELRDTAFPLRFGGRLSLASMERQTLTSEGTVLTTGSNRTAAYLSIGVEAEW